VKDAVIVLNNARAIAMMMNNMKFLLIFALVAIEIMFKNIVRLNVLIIANL